MNLIHYIVVKVGPDDRVMNLRTTINPEDMESDEIMINGGWTRPKQMLAFLAYYFRYDGDGHTRINRAHLDRPMTPLDKIITILEISPWMSWLILGTTALTFATFALLIVHMLSGG